MIGQRITFGEADCSLCGARVELVGMQADGVWIAQTASEAVVKFWCTIGGSMYCKDASGREMSGVLGMPRRIHEVALPDLSDQAALEQWLTSDDRRQP